MNILTLKIEVKMSATQEQKMELTDAQKEELVFFSSHRFGEYETKISCKCKEMGITNENDILSLLISLTAAELSIKVHRDINNENSLLVFAHRFCRSVTDEACKAIKIFRYGK